MTEKPVAIQFGIALEDVRLSMVAYRVTIDTDIENRRDVFRFRAVPIEDVEMSATWGSEALCRLNQVARQFKLIDAHD